MKLRAEQCEVKSIQFIQIFLLEMHKVIPNFSAFSFLYALYKVSVNILKENYTTLFIDPKYARDEYEYEFILHLPNSNLSIILYLIDGNYNIEYTRYRTQEMNYIYRKQPFGKMYPFLYTIIDNTIYQLDIESMPVKLHSIKEKKDVLNNFIMLNYIIDQGCHMGDDILIPQINYVSKNHKFKFFNVYYLDKSYTHTP